MNLLSWVAQDETGIPQGLFLNPRNTPPTHFEAQKLVSGRFFLTPIFSQGFPKKTSFLGRMLVQVCVSALWGDVGEVWG